MPVGQLKRQVTEQEFRDYAAHLAREPTVGEQLNFWMSQLVAVLVNVNRAKGKQPIKPADLIPDRWGDVTPADKRRKFMDQLRGLAAIHGG